MIVLHRKSWLAAAFLALVALLALQQERLGIALSYASNRLQGPFTVQQRLDQFGDAAEQRMLPYYEAAGVDFPGSHAALLAFKDERRLELHAKDAGGNWQFIRDYPIRAASGEAGPKLREGDFQVPEGVYRVTFLNANSRYHVSLRLDYPNPFDRQMARRDGRSQLGGDIMIHGKAVSVGCLAMGDLAAEELFTLAALIGQSKLEVLIAPTDLRRSQPTVPPPSPAWVTSLYEELRLRLQAFPQPADSASRVDF